MATDKILATRIPDFRALPSEAMDQAVNEAVNSRHEVIASLIAQLREGRLFNEGTVYAVYLLGELRAAESVTILIENITLVAHKVDPKYGIGRWGMYPAQEALVKIGLPAVNMILDKLPSERDETRRRLMCVVIADAVGKKVAGAMLHFRYEEDQDPSHRASLGRAMELLTALP